MDCSVRCPSAFEILSLIRWDSGPYSSIYRHHIAGGGGGKRGPMNGPKRGRRGKPGCGWPE